MIPAFHKDNYIDYYVVMESDVLEPEKPEILKCEESSNGDLHFIRFRTTLQSVGKEIATNDYGRNQFFQQC